MRKNPNYLITFFLSNPLASEAKQTHKSQITNHKSQITNHKSQIPNPKSQIQNPKFQIPPHEKIFLPHIDHAVYRRNNLNSCSAHTGTCIRVCCAEECHRHRMGEFK